MKKSIIWPGFMAAVLYAATVPADPSVADYHYAGTVRIDAASGDLDADWLIHVLKPDSDRITFVLRNTLGDVKARGTGVASASVESQPDMEDFTAVSIVLDKHVDNPVIELSYSGVLIPEPMENRINAIEPDRVELNVDSFWFPIDRRFTKLLSAEVDVLLGEGWKGVTTGETHLVDGGLRLVNDDPRMDIVFTASRSFHTTQAEGFTLYDQRKDRAGTERLVEAAGRCRDFLNQRFGQGDPLPASRLLITSRASSGYARQNYIVFTDISHTAPAPLTRFVCHEFAHYWARGGKFDTVDNWINESFAEYIGTMAVREFLGQAEYEAMLEAMAEQIAEQSLPPIWTPGATARGPYGVNYRKGPLVLARLEKLIGKATFLEFTRALFRSPVKTTPGLLDALEQVAGAEHRAAMVAMLAE